jgi:hypothetical protein
MSEQWKNYSNEELLNLYDALTDEKSRRLKREKTLWGQVLTGLGYLAPLVGIVALIRMNAILFIICAIGSYIAFEEEDIAKSKDGRIGKIHEELVYRCIIRDYSGFV